MRKRHQAALASILLLLVVWGFEVVSSRAKLRDLAPSVEIPPLLADSSVGMTRGVDLNQATTTVEIATTTTNAFVVRSVDGDTLTVKMDGSGDEIKVRMLGVNTPESVDPRKTVECFGKEASRYTASMTDGRRVRLDPDPQADEVDKYGRLLRNVVLADGTDLNASLVREGYAHAYLSFPLNKRRKAELKRLETEARAAGRGLWNPETCGGKK